MDRLLLARRTWESDRQQACNEAAKALNVDPSGALGKLESFAGGCDWLIAEWQKVANGLERQVGLNDREVERALQLLAVSQATTVSSRSGQAEFWRCHLALVGSADLGALRRFEKAEPPNGRTNVLARQAEARRRLPSPEQAQGRMRAIVHAEIDRLKALRPQRWADSDLPHRQHAEDLVQFDDSDHATGMKRYESSSSLEVHRCLNQLAKRQRQAEPKQRSNSRARASSQQEALRRQAATAAAALLRRRKRLGRRPEGSSAVIEPCAVDIKAPPATAAAASSPLFPRPQPEPFAMPQPLADRLQTVLRNEATAADSRDGKPDEDLTSGGRQVADPAASGFEPEELLDSEREVLARNRHRNGPKTGL